MKRIKLSLAAVAVCSSAFAGEAINLGDVTVSASKIEQSTLEAPANVTVITASDIEKSNSQRLGDALNVKVPGLYLRGGALGNARPGVTMLSSMRGQGGTLTKIAVLVDGMNMVDAYSGQVNWAMVSMEDVENIEVVPGVGSSLYGSNAMGGVISIKTKEPTKEEMSFNVGKGFGDSAGEYANALYRNKFDNGLGMVFGVSQNNRDGYISEYVTKTPSGTPAVGAVVVDGAIPTTTTTGVPTYIVGDKGLNASKARNIHAKLFYDLTADSKIHAGFAYSDNESLASPYNSYLTDAATGIPVPITTTATRLSLDGKATTIKEQDFAGSIPMGNTALRYFAGYDGKIGDSKLSLNVGKIDRDSWNASIGAAATLTSGAGTLSTSPNSTTNASAQLSSPIGDSQILIVGAATEIGSLHQKKYATSNWTDMDTKTAELDRIDAKSTTNSLFLQDQIAVGDDLLIYVGGRYDSWTAGGTGVVTTGSVPGTFVYPDRSESAFSPKLAGVYQVNNRFSVKSSVGTGFRAPTNYYLFANPTFSGAAAPNGKMIYSNPDLKPEKAKAFDLGVEYHFVEGGKATATYYITKTTNLIYQKITKVDQYTDPVINKVIDYEARQENTGEALARGIELAGEYPLADWLSISGSYAYTDSRITKDDTNTGMAGKRVTNVPKEMFSLAFEAQRGDWSGMLSGRYVGEQFSNNDNSDVVKDVWTGYSKYSVVDLKANYQINKNLKASLMIDNVLDREYYEYYRMPGRGATIQLSANF
ncbi:MAG: TonB-dependent receptor [Sulfuricurvum sp.]|nr:TonB-dependent receptor [Sulfuricurvum sp.]